MFIVLCCKYTNINYKLYSMSDVFYSFIQFLESVRLKNKDYSSNVPLRCLLS